MNRFLLLICSLSLLCACSELFPQDEDLKQPNTEEPQPEEEEPYLDPDTHYLSVHIDNGDSTRVILQDNKSVFTRADLFSVLYLDSTNKWKYHGNNNSTTGKIIPVTEKDDFGFDSGDITVVYPYIQNTSIVEYQNSNYASIYMNPYQEHHTDSYGIESTILIGQTNVENKSIALKSIYGWLRLDLVGHKSQIESIAIQSNSSQILAGNAIINPKTGEFILPTEINGNELNDYLQSQYSAKIINCINAVELNISEPSSFYLSLPPQTYTDGFKVVIRCVDGSNTEYTIDNDIVIKANEVYTYHNELLVENNHDVTQEDLEHLIQLLNSTLAAYYTGYDHSDYGYHSVGVFMDHMAMIIFPCTQGNVYYSRFQAGNYGFDLASEGGYTKYVWEQYMTPIRQANTIIKHSKQSESYAIYRGLAKSYRALLYLNLAQYYDILPAHAPEIPSYNIDAERVKGLTVPIVTENTFTKDAENNPRATREEMFKFILADLKEAEEILSTQSHHSPNCPDLNCVYALYARTYLWLGGFDESYDGVPTSHEAYQLAEKYSRRVIETSGANIMSREEWSDPIRGFNTPVSSWLWYTTVYDPLNNLMNHSAHLCPEALYGYGPVACPGVSSKMYDRLSDTDIRKKLILGPDKSYDDFAQYTTLDQNYFNYFKTNGPYTNFKFRPNMGEHNDYYIANMTSLPIIRIEEMHFINIEAKVHLDRVGEARDDLWNFMNNRAYVYICNDYDHKVLLEEIIFQKSVEFWGEGLVMFDMKRLDMGVNTFDANYPAMMQFSSPRRLPRWNLPIPAYELNRNAGIVDPGPDPSNADIITNM